MSQVRRAPLDLFLWLSDNLNVNESQTFLNSKLVVTPLRKQSVEISDILTWVEAFTIYSLVLCAYVSPIQME